LEGLRADILCSQHSCLILALFEFYLGVVGIEWVDIMGRGTKKVENHWLSLMQVVGFTIENVLRIKPKIWYNVVC